MPRRFLSLLALLCTGCLGGSDGGPQPYPQVCHDDGNPAGPVCAQRVASDADFDALGLDDHSFRYSERITKYMVPAGDDRQDPDYLPPLLQNANRYRLHLEFLRAVFFPGMTTEEYMQKVLQRSTRKYYSGNIARFDDPLEGRFYGFTAYTASSSAELLEPVEVQAILQLLRDVFAAGELRYSFEPFDAMGPQKAKAWVNPGFPIYFPNHDEVKVEVYTPAVNYGRVRRFTLEEFDQAAAAGLLNFEDLVVIENVPFDIEAVVAGVVTGGRQWELSHVNVRMSRRGTPNLFVENALAAFADYDGQLVRLEAAKGATGPGSDSYTVAPATQQEAEEFWSAHRPHLDHLPGIDRDYRSFDRLTEMEEPAPPASLVERFGGKAANLGRLYSILPAEYQVPGFGIPLAHFEDFMRANRIVDRREGGQEEITLRQYVARLAADPRLGSDARYRRELLWDLRSRIVGAARVDGEFLSQLRGRMVEVFGSAQVKVRFRSSSNIEDSLEFSGAGLYESMAACAADDLDDDLAGLSRCDPNQGEEHGVELALLGVWASLYNDRAWDERAWYQVPQDSAGMGVLVTLAFPDERSNGVAFTGQPADPTDRRYLINAQVGDLKVVSNEAELVPEKDLLTLDDGRVSRIIRARGSPLVAPGQYVVGDEELKLLGEVMADLDANYPLDTEGYPREQVLLDLEFKFTRAGQLKIKQIRPFLMSASETP